MREKDWLASAAGEPDLKLSMMKEEPDAKTRRGIRLTVILVSMLAFGFYALYIYLHLKHG